MHIPRLYIPQSLVTGETLVLDDQAAHHVKQVLRLGPGTALRVFDGHGLEHHATLLDVQRNRVSVEIGAAHELNTESPLNITLAQGIPRGDRLERRMRHWERIMVYACEQCGRSSRYCYWQDLKVASRMPRNCRPDAPVSPRSHWARACCGRRLPRWLCWRDCSCYGGIFVSLQPAE